LPEELAGDVGSECGFALGYRLNDGDPWRGATRTAEQSPKRPRFRGSAARRRHPVHGLRDSAAPSPDSTPLYRARPVRSMIVARLVRLLTCT